MPRISSDPQTGWLRRAACALLLAASPLPALGQGISTEGPYTVVRSNTNDALLSFSFQFDVPTNNSGAWLTFDFGFGTAEPDAPGTFYDSFSATLQSTNQNTTALLFTADRSGTEWMPSNPGGLSLNSSNLFSRPVGFPSLEPTNSLQFAYLVRFLLPAELTGWVTLFFDFFDNLNQFASMAFVTDVQVQTNAPPLTLRLQSSAAVSGPFADESGAAIDTGASRISLPLGGTARFFRLRSDLPAVLGTVQIQARQLVFPYAFVPRAFVLQSATNAAGPYADETNAVLNIAQQTVSIALPPGTRFFRIQSDPPATISSQETAGNQLLIHYDFAPQSIILESSASAAGPYAQESGFILDSSSRRLFLPRFGQARFFRLSDTQARTITSLTVSNSLLVFRYQ